MIRYFSYFTIESNILVAFTATALALRPDRDGRRWRVLRLDALVGITVTGIIYVTVLRHVVQLAGLAKVCDIGLHYVSPLITVVAWLLVGPRPRVDVRTLLLALVWPGLYLGYTLIRGEIAHWYPYPFVDVDQHGYVRVLVNSVGVTLVVLAVGAVYLLGDRLLSRR